MERTPTTASRFEIPTPWAELTASRRAYSGLVPISPKTKVAAVLCEAVFVLLSSLALSHAAPLRLLRRSRTIKAYTTRVRSAQSPRCTGLAYCFFAVTRLTISLQNRIAAVIKPRTHERLILCFCGAHFSVIRKAPIHLSSQDIRPI